MEVLDDVDELFEVGVGRARIDAQGSGGGEAGSVDLGVADEWVDKT